MRAMFSESRASDYFVIVKWIQGQYFLKSTGCVGQYFKHMNVKACFETLQDTDILFHLVLCVYILHAKTVPPYI